MDEITEKYLRSLRTQPNRRLVLQEVLTKPCNSKKPLRDQEFFELSINDCRDSWRPGFTVCQWRIQWSEVDQQFMWQDEDAEHWPTLDCAKNRYKARLDALRRQGFADSDMDL